MVNVSEAVQPELLQANAYFSEWKMIAPQLTAKDCWQQILQARG